VPLVKPSEYDNPWAQRRREEAAAMRRAKSANLTQVETSS
jgi:hypothetical protein